MTTHFTPVYFMFATGIECSYPTVRGAAGERVRVDEMRACGHYDQWRRDFDLVRARRHAPALRAVAVRELARARPLRLELLR